MRSAYDGSRISIKRLMPASCALQALRTSPLSTAVAMCNAKTASATTTWTWMGAPEYVVMDMHTKPKIAAQTAAMKMSHDKSHVKREQIGLPPQLRPRARGDPVRASQTMSNTSPAVHMESKAANK